MKCEKCSWIINSEGDAEEAWRRFGQRGRCWKCQRGIIATWRREDPEKHKAYLQNYRKRKRSAKT